MGGGGPEKAKGENMWLFTVGVKVTKLILFVFP
jgi:hypothetical protein